MHSIEMDDIVYNKIAIKEEDDDDERKSDGKTGLQHKKWFRIIKKCFHFLVGVFWFNETIVSDKRI